MSIDAIVDDCILKEDGTLTLVLKDPSPTRSAGQAALVVINPEQRPEIGAFLKGEHIWGNSSDIVYKDKVIAKRIGYTKIQLL